MIKTSRLQNFALYIYFFAINFEMYNFLGLGSTSKLAAIFYVFTIMLKPKGFLRKSKLKGFVFPWIAFVFYLSIVSLFNVNEYSYKIFDVTFILNVVLFFLLLNHARKDNEVLLKGFLFFALGAIFLTVLYYLGIGLSYDFNRATMFGDNQNNLGNRLCVAVIVLVYFAVTKDLFDQWKRYLLLIPCPFLVQFLLDTGSRKSFIALALAMAVAVLMIKSQNVWKKVVTIICSCLLSFYAFLSLKGSFMIFDRLTKTVETGDMAGRDRIWLSILPFIKDNLIFGGGMTGFYKYSTETFGAYNAPHNVIIEILAYSGCIGLSIYFYFLFTVGKQAFNAYKTIDFLLPGLLMIPVLAMTLAGHTLNNKLAWLVYALSVSTVFLLKKRSSETWTHGK